jgi:hypothetical protein
MKLRHTIFFLWIWLLLAAFIREGDLRAYGLQLAGAEALIERGALELGHSAVPELNPQGDVFAHKSSLHPAKQPGQFFWSAAAYALVKASGSNFVDSFSTAAAWTTWLSGTLAAALIALAALLIFEHLNPTRRLVNLTLASLTVFATPLWVYSGVAHHDIMAMCCVTWAFVAWLNARLLTAAFLLAFSSFFSLLVAPGVLGVTALVLWHSRRDVGLFLKYLLGFTPGLAPNLIYNWLTFGSPFMPANIAGDYADTYFRPSVSNFIEKLNTYFGWGELSLWVYAPLAGIAMGYALQHIKPSSKLHDLVSFKFAFLLPILIYILNMETIGHCQFGPRYLMPIFALSLLGLAHASARSLLALSPFAIYSLATNFTGAQSGSMRCDLSKYLNFQYWQSQIATDFFPARSPLLWLLIATLSLALALTTLSLKTKREA